VYIHIFIIKKSDRPFYSDLGHLQYKKRLRIVKFTLDIKIFKYKETPVIN